MTRDKVKSEIKIQEQIEGPSEAIDFVREILEIAKTSADLRSLTTCRFYKYGKHSFQSYRFWYPSELACALKRRFEK